MSLILDELRSIPGEDRRARFVCSIAIAGPDGSIVAESEGICSGSIAEKAHGSGGFGYDPIFIPDGFEMTFGQLSAEVKHEISHRAAAILQIIPFLRAKTAI
jgi:XTP/dITP diphosphohydrolase